MGKSRTALRAVDKLIKLAKIDITESQTLPSRPLHTNAEFLRAIVALRRKIPLAEEHSGAWLPSTELQIHVDISDIFAIFCSAVPNWV